MTTELKIGILEGKIAPRYDPKKTTQLELTKTVITEKGTKSDLPIVDFIMKDSFGNEYFFMVTGRIINNLSATIKATNIRNHGMEEP